MRAKRLAAALMSMGIEACHARHASSERVIVSSVRLGPIWIEVSEVLSAWCARVFEEGDRYAFQSIDTSHLFAMFEREVAARRVTAGGRSLSAWRMSAIELREGAGWHVLLFTDDARSLAVRGGEVALLEWALSHADTACWVDALPVEVAAVIGRSGVPRRVLRQVERGDALAVESRTSYARVGTVVIGHFQLVHGGWQLTQDNDDDQGHVLTRDDALDAPFDGDRRARRREPAGGIDDVPMDIEFVLDRITMTVGELRRLGPGTTFPVGQAATFADAERAVYRVQLVANGLAIGEGELVMLGETLAVQIHRLELSDSSD